MLSSLSSQPARSELSIIIFCNKKSDCDYIARSLVTARWPAMVRASSLTPAPSLPCLLVLGPAMVRASPFTPAPRSLSVSSSSSLSVSLSSLLSFHTSSSLLVYSDNH